MPVVSKINNSQNISKCLKPIKAYVLHTKIDKSNISKFQFPDCKIPDNASKYSYVKVGKTSDKSWLKEVITFFDERGRLLQHIFKTEGKEVSSRNYSYPKKNMRVIDFYSSERKKTSTEIQKWAILNEIKNNSKKQFITKRINYLQDKTGAPRWQIIFTHFPRVGEQKIYKKQCASADIIEKNGKKILTNFQKSGFSGTFDISARDKFLLVRFLGVNTNDGILELTKKYLKQKHLDGLNIHIFPSSKCLGKKTEAEFSVSTRTISFNSSLRNRMPINVVNVAAHEVEHAYQYSMIGRLGKGRSSYETDAYLKLGDLSFDEISEAVKYADARAIYPPYVKGDDISKNPKYINNYLEVKARAAGKNAEFDYINSNPLNYLFFDWAFR